MKPRNLIAALVVAGLYIAGAVAMKAAERAGYLSHDTVVRSLAVFNGLALAVYANFIPKGLGTFRNPATEMLMQAVLRVGGRGFMIGGLGYAIASALPVPLMVGTAILATATAYVFGYFLFAVSRWPRQRRGPA